MVRTAEIVYYYYSLRLRILDRNGRTFDCPKEKAS